MIRSFLACVCLTFVVVSCDTSSRTDYLPRNSGNPGEIIVVAPTEIWNLSVADVVRAELNEEIYGLPQSERLFHCVEVKQVGFKDLFKTHRNIIQIVVDKSNEPKVSIKKDVYARQQVLATIRIRTLNDLENLIKEHAHQLLWYFHNEEISRLVERNKDFGSEEFNTTVSQMTDLDIVMQKDFELAVTDKDFVWLRLDREKPIGGYQHQMSQGIMIYHRPYSDTSQFSDSSLIAWKNQVNKQFVEGPQNSHMTVSDRFILPQVEAITFQESAAREIRGLWRMEGYFMGGPFYALSFYNAENKMQYMVEGYVYAPQFNKLDMIREIEAMVKSVVPVQH